MSEPRIRIEDALRNYAQMSPETFYRSKCEKEAADEIQSLRQRVERLEGALRRIGNLEGIGGPDAELQCADIARAALGGRNG